MNEKPPKNRKAQPLRVELFLFLGIQLLQREYLPG